MSGAVARRDAALAASGPRAPLYLHGRIRAMFVKIGRLGGAAVTRLIGPDMGMNPMSSDGAGAPPAGRG